MMDGNDFGTQAFEDFRPQDRSGTIGPVMDDFQARQIDIRRFADEIGIFLL